MQVAPASQILKNDHAKEILLRVRRRLEDLATRDGDSKYSAKEFERDVAEFVESIFPFSVLSGVRIFSAAERMSDMRGFELDNLFHIREGGVDYIVSIEAKKQRVAVDSSGWMVQYQGRPKCAKMQVNRHLKTLWEYLEPIAQGVQLKFVGIVCAADVSQPMTADGGLGSKLHLCRFDQLTELLERLFSFEAKPNLPPAEIMRVAQSDFLNMLRLSLPVPTLGHPELSNAIRYVDRCRRSLDESLFLEFEPTSERWAINGSAGMGKSVLLAYTAAFLCSGHTLQNLDGRLTVNPSQAILDEIKVPQPNGSIAVVIAAMSEKQLQNLKHWYEVFVNKFGEAEQVGDVRFSKPEFLLCRDSQKLATALTRCDALLVDEAHDLHELAAEQISRSHAERGFYLAVACDRHQKLRLSGADARIIEGIDFQLKSKRLRHIYRNPAPVYLASLALMFRWCGNGGPKVMPSKALLSQSFGLEADLATSRGYQLSIKSDAHPANSWNHTVATFPTAESAYQALSNERMGHREVLWVRFSEEDEDFDYEKLRNFTYHNCRSGEAHLITDKYVKGQEFPIVVIEGFPGFMDRFEDSPSGKADEDKMWQFRREVYLCASRATCFLYFIIRETPPEQTTPECARIRQEIKSLVDQCSRATDLHSGGTRTWRIDVRTNGQRRAMAVFDDAIQSDGVSQIFEGETEPKSASTSSDVAQEEPVLASSTIAQSPEARPTVRPFSTAIDGRISAAELAKLLGVQVHDIISTAKSLGFGSVTAGTPLVADLAEKIAARHRVSS